MWDRKLLVYTRAMFRDTTILLPRYGLVKKATDETDPVFIFIFTKKSLEDWKVSVYRKYNQKRNTFVHSLHACKQK